jgi:glyceraldehyde 3-phosphate dehydrogenase
VTVRLAIDGFGRIGRALYRSILDRDLDIAVVAINQAGDTDALARRVRLDSVHGRFPGEVVVEGDELRAGHQRSVVLHGEDAGHLPWRRIGVDVVVDCTGPPTSREAAAGHLEAGAARVVVAAPCEGADATFVVGVNDHTFDPDRHLVVSAGSPTAGCCTVMAAVLDEAFGLAEGLVTAVQAYSSEQPLLDDAGGDARLGRAAALNVVPAATPVASTTSLVLPAVGDRLDATALRVPVADGSIGELAAELDRQAWAEEVNEAFRAAALGRLLGILEYSDEPLVSSDVVGSTASCVFDQSLTKVRGRLVEVFGWYDNETGFAARLGELCALVGSHR